MRTGLFGPYKRPDGRLMTIRRHLPYLLFLFALAAFAASGCSARDSQATRDWKAFTGKDAPAVEDAAQPQTAPAADAAVPTNTTISTDTAVSTDAADAGADAVKEDFGQGDDDYLDEDEYEAAAVSVADPLRGWNRFWFGFNDIFFGAVRPLADGYAYATPEFFRTGLKNVWDNFIFPVRFVNCLLQFKFTEASAEFGRFMINSTFGLGGFFDLAKSDPDLQPGDEDFGQTLAYYGVGDGFYIVWPILGPSTLRDSIGLIGDAAANPLTYVFGLWGLYGENNPWWISYAIRAGDIFNRLPDKLADYQTLKQASLEPYTSMRDAYMQYRRNVIKR